MAWKAAQKVFRSWKILRGDKVMVMKGKDRGLTGTVQRVLRKENSVIVEGRNLVKKHIRKSDSSPGGILTVESPLHIAKVALLDPVTGAPCRASFKYTQDGVKVRVSRGKSASASIIPRPEALKERVTPRPTSEGPRDTPADVAHLKTFNSMTGESGLPPIRLVDGKWELAIDLPPSRLEFGVFQKKRSKKKVASSSTLEREI